ncbi:hypothetical protein B9Z65_8141 [Elsinoe australis]|uniref:Uncharacterized protein n=1 Tax=Elsinoe australis TaxID=40998 RepID=A0A2P7YW48_9PEZI|nr:hypothetical protein B9Z65_8141 [Elsinoe australis]
MAPKLKSKATGAGNLKGKRPSKINKQASRTKKTATDLSDIEEDGKPPAKTSKRISKRKKTAIDDSEDEEDEKPPAKTTRRSAKMMPQKIKDKQTEIDQLRNRQKELEKEVSGLEDDLEEVMEERDQAKNELRTLKIKHEDLEEKVAALSHQNASYRQTIWANRPTQDFIADDVLKSNINDLFNDIMSWGYDVFEMYSNGVELKRHDDIDWLDKWMPFCYETRIRTYRLHSIFCLISTTFSRHHKRHGPFGPSKDTTPNQWASAAKKIKRSTDPQTYQRWLVQTHAIISKADPDFFVRKRDESATALKARIIDNLEKGTDAVLNDNMLNGLKETVEQAVVLSEKLNFHPATYRLGFKHTAVLTRSNLVPFDPADHKDCGPGSKPVSVTGFIFPCLAKLTTESGEVFEKVRVINQEKVLTSMPRLTSG